METKFSGGDSLEPAHSWLEPLEKTMLIPSWAITAGVILRLSLNIMSSAHVCNHGHQRSKNSALQPWTLPTFSVHCARQSNPNLILLFQILNNNVFLYQLLLILSSPQALYPSLQRHAMPKLGLQLRRPRISIPQRLFILLGVYVTQQLQII